MGILILEHDLSMLVLVKGNLLIYEEAHIGVMVRFIGVMANFCLYSVCILYFNISRLGVPALNKIFTAYKQCSISSLKSLNNVCFL